MDDGIAMERGKRRMEDEKGLGGWGGAVVQNVVYLTQDLSKEYCRLE